ncbi:UDP-3-O-acyl-N-acetylglucosamine deacetylase [Halovulum sp. GXIMD14794]
MRLQNTIARPTRTSGISVQTGQHTTVQLEPAPENTGIEFVRSDVPAGAASVWARPENVVPQENYMAIANEASTVVTAPEHLLAALAIAQVHNVRVVIDGPELPTFDGSVKRWTRLLENTELQPQGARVKARRLARPVGAGSGSSHLSIHPAPSRSFRVCQDPKWPSMGRQEVFFSETLDDHLSEISECRDIWIREEMPHMATAPVKTALFLHAPIFETWSDVDLGPRRHDREFVKHQVLDALAYLSLLGFEFAFDLVAENLTHSLCQSVVAKLASRSCAWANDAAIELPSEYQSDQAAKGET